MQNLNVGVLCGELEYVENRFPVDPPPAIGSPIIRRDWSPRPSVEFCLGRTQSAALNGTLALQLIGAARGTVGLRLSSTIKASSSSVSLDAGSCVGETDVEAPGRGCLDIQNSWSYAHCRISASILSSLYPDAGWWNALVIRGHGLHQVSLFTQDTVGCRFHVAVGNVRDLHPNLLMLFRSQRTERLCDLDE